MTFCSCSNNQRAVAVVATMANCSLIVLAMAIFCRKVETSSAAAVIAAAAVVGRGDGPVTLTYDVKPQL